MVGWPDKDLPRHRPIVAFMHVARRKTGHVEEKLARHRRIVGFVYVADEREYGTHFMSNAQNTNSSKVLYFAHRKARYRAGNRPRHRWIGVLVFVARGRVPSARSEVEVAGRV